MTPGILASAGSDKGGDSDKLISKAFILPEIFCQIFPISNYAEMFGSSKIDTALIRRLEKVTGKQAHYLLKRGILFSHHDLDTILTAHEQGQPFYLYTILEPSSGSLHLGQLIPFMITK